MIPNWMAWRRIPQEAIGLFSWGIRPGFRSVLDIAGKHYATSRFEYDDVCSMSWVFLRIAHSLVAMIVKSTKTDGSWWTGFNSPFCTGTIRNTHFIGLINYVSDEITSRLMRLIALSVIYPWPLIHLVIIIFTSYFRRTESAYFTSRGWFEDQLTDCYMDETTLPSGKVFYAAITNQLLIFMKVMLQNPLSYGCLCSRPWSRWWGCYWIYQGVNVSELAGGRIKIHDRRI